MGTLLTNVLGRPDQLVADGEVGRDAPGLLALAAAGAAAFGAAVGSQHEGVQWLYAALKMPAVFVVPPLLLVPALRAGAEVLGVELDARRGVLAALGVSARAGLVAGALSPLVWLLSTWSDGYRSSVGWSSLAFVFAGAVGLRVLVPLLPAGGLRRWWLASAAVVFLLLAGQTGWHLRPFVLRPHLPVAFLDHGGGDVITTMEMRAGGRPGRGDHEQLEALGYVDGTVERK